MSCVLNTVNKCASGSAVEHHLAKVGAAGSIPVSRSGEKSPKTLYFSALGLFFCFEKIMKF